MWLASKAIEEALKLATEETTKVATKELLHHALAVRNGTQNRTPTFRGQRKVDFHRFFV